MDVLGKRIVVTAGKHEGQHGTLRAICDPARPTWHADLDNGRSIVLSGMHFCFEVAR